MHNTERVITLLYEGKDNLSPKQKKILKNIVKDIKDLAIARAQSVSKESIKTYIEAVEILKNNV